MLLDTTPLTSDGEDAVSFPRDMSADEGTPPPERVTNFFIADILSPDFGRKRCKKCAIRSDGAYPRVPSEGLWGEGTAWEVSEYRGKSELPTGVLSGKKEAGKEKPEWPAWVYCTRYSDRPTAGERSFTLPLSLSLLLTLSPYTSSALHITRQ